jgi:hypothetical protein
MRRVNRTRQVDREPAAERVQGVRRPADGAKAEQSVRRLRGAFLMARLLYNRARASQPFAAARNCGPSLPLYNNDLPRARQSARGRVGTLSGLPPAACRGIVGLFPPRQSRCVRVLNSGDRCLTSLRPLMALCVAMASLEYKGRKLTTAQAENSRRAATAISTRSTSMDDRRNEPQEPRTLCKPFVLAER